MRTILEEEMIAIPNSASKKIWDWILDKGLVFGFMAIVIVVMYTWISESNRVQKQEIKDLKIMISDCANARKDKLESEVYLIRLKIDELLLMQKLNENKYGAN